MEKANSKKYTIRKGMLSSLHLLVLSIFCIVLNSCDMREGDVADICKSAREGDHAAMLAAVTFYEEYFKDAISIEEYHTWCDTLETTGIYNYYHTMSHKEWAAYQQNVMERRTRGEHVPFNSSLRDSINLKWWRIGAENHCGKCYSNLYKHYRHQYRISHDAADSLLYVKYHQEGEQYDKLMSLDSVMVHGVWAAFADGVSKGINELSQPHYGTLLNTISHVGSSFTIPFASCWFEQLFTKANWWKVLIAIVLFVLALAAIGFLGLLPIRHNEHCLNFLSIMPYIMFYNVFLMFLVEHNPDLPWVDSLDRSIGAIFYPDGAYGLTPYWGMAATWLMAIAFVINLVYGIIQIRRQGAMAIVKFIALMIYSLFVSYTLLSLAGFFMLFLIIGLILGYLGVVSSIGLIKAAPGMVGEMLSNAVTIPVQGSSSSSSGYSSDSSSDDSGNSWSTNQTDDIVISHGGTFGEDIRAHRNADGSLTDTSGGHWEGDAYGNYSKT